MPAPRYLARGPWLPCAQSRRALVLPCRLLQRVSIGTSPKVAWFTQGKGTARRSQTRSCAVQYAGTLSVRHCVTRCLAAPIGGSARRASHPLRRLTPLAAYTWGVRAREEMQRGGSRGGYSKKPALEADFLHAQLGTSELIKRLKVPPRPRPVALCLTRQFAPALTGLCCSRAGRDRDTGGLRRR